MSEPAPRLSAGLEQLGAEHEPPPGWEARVFAAIDQRQRRRRCWLAIPAAALAVVALVIARPMWRHDGPLALQVTITPTRGAAAPKLRGTAVHVGDRVHASVTGGDRHRAIWVYRDDDELVVVCPGGLSCATTRGATEADVTLADIGTYVVLAVASTSPLPAPLGRYDVDRAAVEQAGAKTLSRRLTVR